MRLMYDMNKQQHSTQQLYFSLMEVKLNLFELFILGAYVTKCLHDMSDVRTSA